MPVTTPSAARRAARFADESPVALTRRARRIHRALLERYPYAHCELDFETPLQLLVATVLSAQTTDVMVNTVTPTLFSRWPTAEALAGADREEMEAVLRPTGFFRAKTNSVINLSAAIVERFDGEVPGRLADLVTLPGVGRKTANVVLGNAFGVPGITVDTHFGRLVRRFGWTAETDPVKVEHAVGALFPQARLDDAQPRADLPRPPHLPRPQARLWRLPGRAVVPVVRRGRDRPGQGQDAARLRARPGRPAARPAARAAARRPAGRRRQP